MMGVVRPLVAAVWIALIVIEVVGAANAAGPLSGAAYLGAAITGALGTIAYLRGQALSAASRLVADVEAGRIAWGARVRCRTTDGRAARFAGSLAVTQTFEFVFTPDSWSKKRGAEPRSWAPGARIVLGATRRDITGLVVHDLLLTPRDSPSVRFFGYGVVGSLPAICRAT
ncbi:hypothetical protein GCM10028801_39160 [Nocardioides maradonensis]